MRVMWVARYCCARQRAAVLTPVGTRRKMGRVKKLLILYALQNQVSYVHTH